MGVGKVFGERKSGRRVLAGWRRPVAELALLAAAGALTGFLGPFGSNTFPVVIKYGYWLVSIVGGGLIGIVIDTVIGRWLAPGWRRVVAVSVLMTPLVTLHVLVWQNFLFAQEADLAAYVRLLAQVLVISLPIMAVRALVWRRPEARVEIRTVIEPPLPAAEAAFRRRLSAKRRSARLIAVEAQDHYLRVHTDAGPDLIALRFADALAELSQAHGYQVHRSWWVSADAIQEVRWRRGSGEARLVQDLCAPVSRTYAPTLKAAGWL